VRAQRGMALDSTQHSLIRHTKMPRGDEPGEPLMQQKIVPLLGLADWQTKRLDIAQHISGRYDRADVVEQASGAALALIESVLHGNLRTDLGNSLDVGERFRFRIGFEQILNVNLQVTGKRWHNDIGKLIKKHTSLLEWVNDGGT